MIDHSKFCSNDRCRHHVEVPFNSHVLRVSGNHYRDPMKEVLRHRLQIGTVYVFVCCDCKNLLDLIDAVELSEQQKARRE